MGTGILKTDIGALDRFNDVVIQPDGKIVAVGVTFEGGAYKYTVVRYNPNGSLDLSFGNGGIVTTKMTTGSETAQSVILQSDGKILVAGMVGGGLQSSGMGLARYNADGSLDTSFGGGTGKVVTSIGDGSDYDMALQPDGKIIVSGQFLPGGTNSFGVARFNVDGTLDTTFGGGDGFESHTVGVGQAAPYDLIIEPNGAIVLVGSARDSSAPDDKATGFALARFTANGTFDPSFGAITQIGTGVDYATAIARQADGKLVVVGRASDSNLGAAPDDVAVVRYNANGSLDTTFGGGTGIVRTFLAANGAFPEAVAIQADGKIVVGGSVAPNSSDFALVRYNANGTLDTSFGGGTGKVLTTMSTRDEGYALSLQPDGKILLVGMIGASQDDFGAVRYNSDGTLDLTFGGLVKDGLAGNDTLTASDDNGWELNGRDGNDSLVGAGGADVLNGGIGNDTLRGAGGADALNGGVGYDIAQFASAFAASQITFENGAIVVNGPDGRDTLTGIERLDFTDGIADVRYNGRVATQLRMEKQGGASGETLTGGQSWDRLFGNGGNDRLIGGEGNDLLDGGAGVDTAAYGGLLRSYQTSLTQVSGAITGTDTLVSIENQSFVDGRLTYDENDLAAALYRLYDATLDRGPDSLGFIDWLHALQGGTTLNQAAAAFVTSPEFIGRYGNLSNQGFVEQLYRFCLNREGDASGVAAWVAALNAGTSRADLVLTFSESSEHRVLSSPTLNAGIWIQDDQTMAIARLYDATFDRLPDAQGLEDWRAALAGGTTLAQASVAFAGAQEFQNKYGNLTNQAFVEQIYRFCLDREGEPAGVADWVSYLNNGGSRPALLLLFSESSEHVRLTQPMWERGITYVNTDVAATDATHPIADERDFFFAFVTDNAPGNLGSNNLQFANDTDRLNAAPFGEGSPTQPANPLAHDAHDFSIHGAHLTSNVWFIA